MRTVTQRGAASLSGVVITALLLVVAAIVFFGIYLAVPQDDHYWALVTIGILALLFAVGSYFGEALSSDPSPARMATFGFLGMGFAVLFLTILFDIGGVLSLLAQLVVLVILILLVIGVVAMARWRGSELGREHKREERRAEWATTAPPSALDYAAARSVAPPPAPPADGAPPPGGAS